MWSYAALFIYTAVIALLIEALRRVISSRRKTFSYFKEIGVDGPPPNLIWGNLWEYHRKGIIHAIHDWCEKYGDVFGFYNGDVPTLVVKDLDFLSYVFIKNFSNFMNRGVTMRTDEQHELLGRSLLHAQGLQWKRTRSCVSYAFTASKFKQVFPHMDRSCDRLLEAVRERANSGKEESVGDLFKPLTMDYISGASFGIQTSFQEEKNHPLFLMAKKVLPGTMTGPFHMIAQATTTLKDLVAPLLWLNSKLGSFTYDKFSKLAYKAVEARRKNPSPRSMDILQIMLEAETDENFEGTEVKNGQIKVQKKLTRTEVSVNTGVLLIAGFGTTSAALSNLSFVLAKYPEVQDKVREEVNAAMRKHGRINYAAVTEDLKYLSNVVDETLRIYPVVVAFNTRSALNDFEYEGVKYKAGLSIMSPTIEIQKDPRFWTEPEKFDPDRFLPENVALQHTMAYQPFGQGPRNCIGKRLALLETIYTAARMVHEFRFELGESQKEKNEMMFYSMVCEPKDGPWIKFTKIADSTS
ncbi:cytochrome P450 3A9 [Ixodes scapularis]|uniref:cytochrome P450 3A9 n=1 Tax=Ixodes scapularis TaxID=6945 RepID=UPI001A9FD652|nr:cytochrome P450 3A9 [Ixodes scapularis]